MKKTLFYIVLFFGLLAQSQIIMPTGGTNSFANTDGQQLTLVGNVLTLENSDPVDLTPYLDNTDGQTVTDFSLSGNTLSLTISGGNTIQVDLSGISGGGGTIDVTIQDGSTNAVQNNAIFDALGLKTDISTALLLTGAQTVDGSKIWNDSQIYRGGEIVISSTSSALTSTSVVQYWNQGEATQFGFTGHNSTGMVLYNSITNDYLQLNDAGTFRNTALTGSGTQMIVADANGFYSRQAIPSGGSTPEDVPYSSSWDGDTDATSKNTLYDWGESLTLLGEKTATTSRTAVLTDGNGLVNVTNGSAMTFTVPLNSSVAFEIGASIFLRQNGAGNITVAYSGGVTGEEAQTFGYGQKIVLWKTGTDTWIVTNRPSNAGVTQTVYDAFSTEMKNNGTAYHIIP